MFLILSLISIIKVQNCSLQGGRRCTVCPNAEQIASLHTGSSGRHHDQTGGSRPMMWQGAPWNTIQSQRHNKASFAARCRTLPQLPVSEPLPPLLTCTGRTVPAPRPQQGVLVDPHLCRSRAGGTPGLPWARIIPSPNTSLLLRIHSIAQIGTLGDPG